MHRNKTRGKQNTQMTLRLCILLLLLSAATAATSSPCSASSFPVATKGQCRGLDHAAAGDTDPNACALACCKTSGGTMWQYSINDAKHCWVGTERGGCDPRQHGWIGGSKAAPAPGPTPGPPPSPGPSPSIQAVAVINFTAVGPQFHGLGACSGGTGARLLYDYPEPQRSQALDAVFKPGAGASLQVCRHVYAITQARPYLLRKRHTVIPCDLCICTHGDPF